MKGRRKKETKDKTLNSFTSQHLEFNTIQSIVFWRFKYVKIFQGHVLPLRANIFIPVIFQALPTQITSIKLTLLNSVNYNYGEFIFPLK